MNSVDSFLAIKNYLVKNHVKFIYWLKIVSNKKAKSISFI